MTVLVGGDVVGVGVLGGGVVGGGSLGGATPGFDVEVLTRGLTTGSAPALAITVADEPSLLSAARRLRHQVFVTEQGLFAGADRDDLDNDPRTLILVARDPVGAVLGTVRLGPARPDLTRDLGWWVGSRLAVSPEARGHRLGVGSALVRAACAHVETLGALRFDALVQEQNARLFDRLGWHRWPDPPVGLHGRPHVAMTWPIRRIQTLVDRTKTYLSGLLGPLQVDPRGLGGARFRGDDGAPVPGSDLVAATDAIIPSMVERDPEWAGWCAVLVNVNDLAAMGAVPVALLDSLAARDASFAARVMNGLQRAAAAWRVPVIGGHTQLGTPAALSVTALGRTERPVPAAGGQVGHRLTLTADLGGGWRPGYRGAQWDSTSARTPDELATQQSFVARTAPAAAKDVSMAGLVGTVGMLAESSGCGAELDVAAVPVPAGVRTADWFTCFPGFAMITADSPGAPTAAAGPAVSAGCGDLVATPGVRLRWPDGRRTTAVAAGVTGLVPGEQTFPPPNPTAPTPTQHR